ncbi:ketoacyl reductase [filamentous cyanobacterium CCP5]|nr:ketoacyl reductase [filamentous cyanobacterium CCT1]PSN15068.1 ketoacyl reductase [filamentous cyanobacterium CCP5]
MDFGIRDKVAVITGGDSGMGLATAKLLTSEGAKVALIDLTQAELEAAAKEVQKIGEALPVHADLRDWEQVEAARKKILDHYGRVDILVNAAGITGPTKPFLELSDEDWWGTLDTDFMAAVRVCRAFIPSMQQSGWGRVVLFTSEDAVQPYTDEMPYCSAKAAVLTLAKNLSKEFAQDGVLVNSVSPAYIASPMTDAMMEQRAKEKGMGFDEAIATFLEEKRPHLVLNRRGKVQEVAAVVAFLCSELSSFVVGANYRVDGGSVATIAT